MTTRDVDTYCQIGSHLRNDTPEVTIGCYLAIKEAQLGEATNSENNNLPAFDADAFYQSLDAERRSRKLNWKDVANEARVSQSTLTRLGQGRRPDVDSFALLVAWGGLDADRFVAGPRQQPTGGFLSGLPTYLRSDPNLNEDGVRSLEAIIKTAYEQFKKKA